ncbi:hypothetical protein [Clostridium sp. VAP52]|uniref:hypothetical protein n=1 Tax=Clostridium sp. VAP52 TaxID=2949977 RepID=UPI00207A9958|nr:hypothetical protein [Clostridium sp. VAP52]
MKLYEIGKTHYAPKDSEYGIQEYVVANNDEEVFNYLKTGYAYWEDIVDCCESDDESLEDAENTLNEIFENHGDNREVYDLYYGATQYCWEEVKVLDDNVIGLMIKNKLANDIRKRRD